MKKKQRKKNQCALIKYDFKLCNNKSVPMTTIQTFTYDHSDGLIHSEDIIEFVFYIKICKR